MTDIATIEAINSEQLATATDRLLLRGRVSKQRPSTRSLSPLARGAYAQLTAQVPRAPYVQHAPQPSKAPLARGSQPRIVIRPSQTLQVIPLAYERTVPARKAGAALTQVAAVVLAVPTLVGLAVGIAALL